MRRGVILIVAGVLALSVLAASGARAERATAEEMERVCQNWLAYVVSQRGAWIGEFLDEVEAFPGGSHDDQVDASSSALLQLIAEPEPREELVVIDTVQMYGGIVSGLD